ncbi:MAG TPA: hypothetical protein VGI70_02145, partial [Polyangiales bacterium]
LGTVGCSPASNASKGLESQRDPTLVSGGTSAPRAGAGAPAGSGAVGGSPASTGGTPIVTPTAGTSAGSSAIMPPAAGFSGAMRPPTGGALGMTPPVSAAGSSGGIAGTTASQPPTPKGDDTCLQKGDGSYGEPGPYKVGMMDVDLGMIESGQTSGKFTIYYPMPFETSCKHPIVAWGNGTGVMGSQVYEFFNSNAASWGMVVAASQENNTGSGNFHKAGIDWLLAQNVDSTSMFFGKLSTRAGVAGHSQGGFGATLATSHPNVETLVSVAGGGTPKMGVDTLCLTGTMDMVEAPCTAEYMAASGPAFLGDWMNGDHTTTETLAGYIKGDKGSLQMQRLLAAWFRCWLADDQVACALFKGAPDNCGICKDDGWAKHESRNF